MPWMSAQHPSHDITLPSSPADLTPYKDESDNFFSTVCQVQTLFVLLAALMVLLRNQIIAASKLIEEVELHPPSPLPMCQLFAVLSSLLLLLCHLGYAASAQLHGPKMDSAADEQWFNDAIAVMVCLPLVVALGWS